MTHCGLVNILLNNANYVKETNVPKISFQSSFENMLDKVSPKTHSII